MTIEELEVKLDARKERIEKEEAEKYAQEKAVQEVQMKRFLSLKESIKKDLEIGRRVVEAGVKFPKNASGRTKFVTDSFRHGFGFYIDGTIYENMKHWKFQDQIGWENGGACGDWDVMYDPAFNEDEILLVHREKTEPDRKAPWETVKRFCDKYEKFHEKFHEWLETIE